MKEGIWLPRALLKRYGLPYAVVAAAVFEAYLNLHDAEGEEIIIHLPDFMNEISWVDSPHCRKRLIDEYLRPMFAPQKIGFEIQGDTLRLWFTPFIAQRAEQYKKESTWILTPPNQHQGNL